MNFIEDSFRPRFFALYFKNTVHVYNTKSKTMTFTFSCLTPQKTNIRLCTRILTYVHTLRHQQVSLAAVAAVKTVWITKSTYTQDEENMYPDL